MVVDGGPAGLVNDVRDLIWRLERLWSRFLETSEVAALNNAPGSITVVSKETFLLASCAVRAQEATGGLFNPLMLSQLESHGYRESWESSDRIPSMAPI